MEHGIFFTIDYMENEIFFMISYALLLWIIFSQKVNNILLVANMSGGKKQRVDPKQRTLNSWKGFKRFVVHRRKTVTWLGIIETEYKKKDNKIHLRIF